MSFGLIPVNFFAADAFRLFYVNVEMPRGATIEQTLEVVQQAEDRALALLEEGEELAATIIDLLHRYASRGETAPLLIIAGSTDSLNLNLFGERMMTLPVYIYYSYTQPGVPAEFGQERAWGAALVLIVIVMTLNLVARAIGRRYAPKTGR